MCVKWLCAIDQSKLLRHAHMDIDLMFGVMFIIPILTL